MLSDSPRERVDRVPPSHPGTSQPARRPHGLLVDLADVPEVWHVVVTGPDGLPRAAEGRMGRDRVDQLAAIAFSVVNLAVGLTGFTNAGRLSQTLVEMHRAVLVIAALADGSALAVLADHDADLGRLGHDIAVLANRLTGQPPTDRAGDSHLIDPRPSPPHHHDRASPVEMADRRAAS